MLKSHEQFHSANGKRLVLVVDDELINREMLGAMLGDQYEIIYAGNGEEALEQIRANAGTLSLVLLDLLMPVMSGIDVLKAVKNDPELSQIPIIVMTADEKAEIECLNLGANDFISKPYPDPGVIQARVLKTIELSEDREIIQSTERDPLTGLYNKEYFYRYCEQYDNYHKDKATDAVIIDVSHFHMINERYGKAYGDQVLMKIGQEVKKIVQDSGGIVSRREADTFMVYCPHREDYQEMLDIVSDGVSDDEAENRVRLRMGVYADCDKSMDIERRFDRAKMAADTIKGNFNKTIALYDAKLHENEIYSEQLVEDFYTAIKERQFVVYYQPKFDVRNEPATLASAEALVRWNHPELGMINPGVFIPLFENNGLIARLDHYVWDETCRQMKEWRDKYDFYVPVSVNVSRIDLYDPEIKNVLKSLLEKYDLQASDLMLEITESAYTQDSQQIVEVVSELRNMGFKIEMDDFGTGYSSLNMVSTLPFDVLKLDMLFMRSAFRESGDTRMMELIIDIAEYLSVPVIAEGVETEDQLSALKLMGCDLVQGYYFSKPVPAEEFAVFIEKRKEQMEKEKEKRKAQAYRYAKDISMAEDAKKEEELRSEIFTEEGPEEKIHSGLQLRTASVFFVILAVGIAIGLFLADLSVARGYSRMEQASDRYIAAQMATSEMESTSDYLTDRVRCFVVTGDINYLNDFIEEVEVTKRRDEAVENLEELLEGRDPAALNSLNSALALSNELVLTENKAMRLKLEAEDYDLGSIPETIRDVQLSEEESAMSAEELSKLAETLVFDNNYMHTKDKIRENVSQCTQALIKDSSIELEEATARMNTLVTMQTVITVMFLLIVLMIVLFIDRLIRKPLTDMVGKMQNQEEIPPAGAEELQYVARTYNKILAENKEAHERLSHEASHDALTGLLNRGAYDMMMETVDTSHIALIIVDVDYFKSVNDTYGHAVGDRVLKRVADILRHSFRSVDIICRIGGDEFVVIMTRVNSSMGQLVMNKIAQANEILQNPKDDLPPISLSVGVAFSDRKNPQGDIFKDADTALYRVKEAGRNGCAIY